ncbi:MAG: lytic transglycosylase domain-containing protein [Bryobacteraceae bacterium]
MGFRSFLLLAACLPLTAGELAVFASGVRLQADRHEVSGNIIRLFHGAGVSEVPAASIVAFEPIEDVVVPEQPQISQALNAPQPVAKPSSDPRILVREAALRAGLPPEFVASVANVESAMRPDAISSKGAIGVMQLMPATAKSLGADPHDMRQNIDAGARLLRDLLLKYDGDVVKALSAYNAGPGAVARYQGLPPYDETRRYVNKVIGAYQASTPE